MTANPDPLKALPENPAEVRTVYSNISRISHSPADFVIDFAQVTPNQTTPQLQARVIMSPLGAKLFLRALQENIARFETNFNEIIAPNGKTLADDLFKPGSPPEPPKEK